MAPAIRGGSLRLFGRFHVDDFAALVGTTVRADTVRHHGFVALWAILNLDCGNMVVAAARSLAGLRGTPFGYGHDGSRVESGTRGKAVMLGPLWDCVKDASLGRIASIPVS